MIAQLVVEFTVDSYMVYGSQAEGANKPRLAMHYYQLALKLMTRDDVQGKFKTRADKVRQTLESLERLLQHQGERIAPGAEEGDGSELNGEWGSFGTEDEHWKKKQVYD